MPKCLFLRPQMEFLGSVKAQNHQNLMDLSQVNRPMGLGQNLAPNLPLTESKAAKIGWKYPKRQIFRFFHFWGLKNRLYAQKFKEYENSGINNAKNGKKNKNWAGPYFDIRPRTWEVWFWPSLANCPLSAPNYPYVQRVLHGWNRTDLTILKWYDTWYLGWKMPP